MCLLGKFLGSSASVYALWAELSRFQKWDELGIVALDLGSSLHLIKSSCLLGMQIIKISIVYKSWHLG